MVTNPPPFILKVKGNKTFRPFSRLESTEDLVRTWKTCSKVAVDLEDGKRLENLSWRLWSSSLQRQDDERLQSTMAGSSVAGATATTRMVRNSRAVAERLSADRNRPLKQLTAPGPKRTANLPLRNVWRDDPSEDRGVGPSSVPLRAARDLSAPRVGIEPDRTDVEIEMEMALGLRRKSPSHATATRTSQSIDSSLSLFPGINPPQRTGSEARKCEAADLDASLDSFGIEGHRTSPWPGVAANTNDAQSQWLASSGSTSVPPEQNGSKVRTLPSTVGQSIPFDELLSQFVSMNDVNDTLDLDQLIDFGCPLANAVAGGSETRGLKGDCEKDAEMSSGEEDGEEGTRRSRPVCCMQRLLSPASQKRLGVSGGCCQAPPGEKVDKSPDESAELAKHLDSLMPGVQDGSSGGVPQALPNSAPEYDLFAPPAAVPGNVSRSSPTNGCLLTTFASSFPGIPATGNANEGGNAADDASIASSTTAVASAPTMDPRVQLLQWLSQQRTVGAGVASEGTQNGEMQSSDQATGVTPSWPGSLMIPTPGVAAGPNESLTASPMSVSMIGTPRDQQTPYADPINMSSSAFGRSNGGLQQGATYDSPASSSTLDAKGKRKRTATEAEDREVHQPLALLSAAAAAASATSSTSSPSEVQGSSTLNTSSNPHAGQRNQVCFSCGTTSTPLWRRDANRRVVCNRCGLRKTKKPKRSSGAKTDDAEGDGVTDVAETSTAKASSKAASAPARPSEGPHVPRVRTEGVLQCHNCGTTITSLWRKDESTGLRSCNPCGLWLRHHGTPRPLAKRTDVIRRRQRFFDDPLKEEGEDGGKGSVDGGDDGRGTGSRQLTPASQPGSRAATPNEGLTMRPDGLSRFEAQASLWPIQTGEAVRGASTSAVAVGPSVPLSFRQQQPQSPFHPPAPPPTHAYPTPTGLQPTPAPGGIPQDALQMLQAQMQVHLANALAHFQATGTIPPIGGGVAAPAHASASSPAVPMQAQLAQQALLSVQGAHAASPWTPSTSGTTPGAPPPTPAPEASPAAALSPEASRQLLAALGQSLGIPSAPQEGAGMEGFEAYGGEYAQAPQETYVAQQQSAASGHGGSTFAILAQQVLQNAGQGSGSPGGEVAEDEDAVRGSRTRAGERGRGKRRGRVAVEG